MSRLLLTVFLLLAFTPTGAPDNVQYPISFGQPVLARQTKRPHEVITLRRTSCFGSCPVYKVRIFSDGRVLYEGTRFVRKKGKVESRISQAELWDLITEFSNIYYFNLDDTYGRGSEHCPKWKTDHPSAITSLVLDDKRKSITHDLGCDEPGSLSHLTRLEEKIDEAVNVNQWTK